MDENLEFTLSGRLRNIVLAPSARNSVLPLFEAITNSLHAIEDRFGPDNLNTGKLTIAIERENGRITSCRVDDNGEGLTPQNYKSFLTSDSTRKIARGGKGVGRLLWLKVFSHIDIDSYYQSEESINRLSFRFTESDKSPISNKKIDQAQKGAIVGTSVRMEKMKDSFQSRAPKKKGTIEAEIIRHFVSYLISDNSPSFFLYDDDSEKINLSDYFRDHIHEQLRETISINIDSDHKIDASIHHLLISKQLRDSELGHNTVYLNANGRNVESYAIDAQLGLTTLRDEFVYMGVISSQYFDEYVSQERTHLTIDSHDKDAIRREIFESIKKFLAPDIAEVRDDQREKAEKVIDSNPRFMSISGDLDKFLETKVPLSMRNEEEIHLAFEREYRRERNRYAKDYLKIRNSQDAASIKTRLEKYVGFMNDDVKFTLAEYVIRRKAILDVVTDAHGYQDVEKRKHHLEQVIHEYICPMRSTTDDMDYESHNLWMIDDRLAFYNYFASDKPIKNVQPGNSDRRKPDIALFDLGLGLRREGSDQPVVIVEFKRPGREEYSNDSPVQQIVNYIMSLRGNGSVKDKNGRVLANLNENTSFIGYIIADMTNGLRGSLLGSFVNRRTADGIGLWGFEENIRTYIEIIPYEKLFRDAKCRNEVFFTKLKLQS